MKLKLDYIDKDEKYIDFTQNNIDLINFCLSVDSSYRNAFNEKYEGSSAELIKNHWKFDNVTIEKICKQIDKENKTHLAVSGKKENPKKIDDKYNENNQGVKIVVDGIMKITDIENRIKIADTNLVNEIACFVNGFAKFSFASKFCTYISRYKFGKNDDYSIYDKVISDILPFYQWKFLHTNNDTYAERKSKRIESTIEENFANKEKGFNYAGYNQLIEEIIKAINKQNKKKLKGTTVDRKIFDRLLWYYYKGDKKLRQDALNAIQLQY